MNPNTFEPKTKNRWVFAIDGIDQFLMKKVKMPSFKMDMVPEHDIERGRNPKSIVYAPTSTVNFTIYDSIAPSGTQQITQWMQDARNNNGWKSATFKLLDPLGIVIDKWTMDLILNSFEMSEYDYDMAGAVEISVEAQVRNMTFQAV